MEKFIRRSLCLILSAVLAFLLALCAYAGDVSLASQGKTVVEYGDWILEKINGDTQFELDSYVGSDVDIITPRLISNVLVVAYGEHCFANNDTVRSVVTSSPLRTVCDYAFLDCTALESFGCNYALNSIGVGAFAGTSSLTEIDLETSVISSVSAFSFADSGLTHVSLPSTCISIGRYAFVRCGDLESIIIPDSVTEIADNAFEGCDKLVVYAAPGSYAAEYAVAHGIPLAVEYLVGDADGDGMVSILDATRIQRLLVDLEVDADGLMALRGDCNGDGMNILDATKIQRYLAGYTVAESIGAKAVYTI